MVKKTMGERQLHYEVSGLDRSRRTAGTVVKIKGKQSISVADGSGLIKSFKLASNTVADTEYGAVIGFKYQPHLGDKIRVIATVVNENETALFINSLVTN